MALQQQKGKLKAAKKGHELLKKKADALKKSFREVMLKIIDTKKRMGKEFSEAMLALAEANFAAGDFGRNMSEQVKSHSNIRLGVAQDNVAGVSLPKFSIRGEDKEETDDKAMLGLTGGGKAITKCREKFGNFLKLLTQIASHQSQFLVLDEVIKVTNRRVNALEFVVVPRIDDNIKFIDKELDEQAREDFFRLKRVTDKKKIEKEKQMRENELKKEAAAAGGVEHEEEQQHDNIFQEEDDEDVVF
jgi:V-type H+-transporting ATPase subunit D